MIRCPILGLVAGQVALVYSRKGDPSLVYLVRERTRHGWKVLREAPVSPCRRLAVLASRVSPLVLKTGS